MALATAFGLTAILTAPPASPQVGFREAAIVQPTSTSTGGHFGNSVDINGSVMIAGAPYQGLNGTSPAGTGCAQVSLLSDWTGEVTEQIDLSASDGVEGDLFGMRVVIGSVTGSSDEGGVAYCSAPRRGAEGVSTYAGAVYAFAADGESEISEIGIIEPSGVAAQRGFGTSLAFDGARIAVGAPYDSESGFGNHGSVFVYTLGLDGLPTNEERVVCDSPATGQYLGWSVSIDGDRMAVGAIADSIEVANAGAVYIFDRNGDDSWSQTAVVTPSDLGYGAWFGTSVVVHGDYLIASSINYVQGEGEDAVSNLGVVYVFKWTDGSFAQVDELYPPLAESGIAWGVSVDFDGVHLVVGGNGWQNEGEFGTGSAGVYEVNPSGEFEFLRAVIGSDVVSSGRFGSSVALSGDRFLVGSIQDAESHGGATYLFEPTCGGDFDSTGSIGYTDLLEVVSNWGGSGIRPQDVVQDFDVDIYDLLSVLENFGVCE